MILFLDTGDRRLSFRLNEPEDFDPIFEMFPGAELVARYAADVGEAAEFVAEYLSNHHMEAWIEGDELHKGLKEAVIGAGMAAMMAATPMAKEPTAPQVPKQVVHVSQPVFGTKPEDKFLWAIQQIESDGGKNLNHQEIKTGPNKGDRAMGRWGLLRPTVLDVLARHKNWQKGKLEPHLQPLMQMSRDQMEKYFQSNPDAEMHVARLLAHYVIRRQKGDLNRAAYSWLHGHYINPEDIHQDKLDTSDYVSKFREYMGDRVPAKVSKAEFELEEKSFKERLKEWAAKHATIARQGFESNWAADTGRKHDDSEEGPSTDKARTIATIKELAQRARDRKLKP
jgi:hypothetical protein